MHESQSLRRLSVATVLGVLFVCAGVARAQDPYEPNDSFLAATPVAIGFATDGATIAPAGDVDVYGFDAQVGDEVVVYAFQQAGSDLDGRLWLYDNAGNCLLSNDDAVPGDVSQSLLRFTFGRSGRYFVRYAHFDDGDASCATSKQEAPRAPAAPTVQVGGYHLVIGRPTVDPYEPNDTAADAFPIELGFSSGVFAGRVAAAIDPATRRGDIDYFRFDATAGDRIYVFAENLVDASEFDGRLWLFNADGTLLAQNDDYEGRTHSLIVYDVPAGGGGTLFIRYALWENDAAFPGTARQAPQREAQNPAGAYRLRVARFTPPLVQTGSGFDAIVPIGLASTTNLPGEVYRISRSTLETGPFEPLATSPRPDFVDDGLENGTVYFYSAATALPTLDVVSPRSAAVTAAPGGGYAGAASLATSQPSLNGVLGENEWREAVRVNVTSPYTGAGAPVTMYVKNDNETLYLGFDDPNGTIPQRNQLGLFFDRDNDDAWADDGTEGNLFIDDLTGATRVFFRGITGTYPDFTLQEAVPQPTGVAATVSLASGHAQYEIAIDLSESPLRAEAGGTIGLWVFISNGTNANGSLPPAHSFNGNYPPGPLSPMYVLPPAFADLVLARENQPPRLQHTPLATPATAGQPVTLTVDVVDDVPEGLSATLVYFLGGSEVPQNVPMQASGASSLRFEGAIPASAVTARGLTYTLQVRDAGGLTDATPRRSIQVHVPGEGLEHTVAAAGDTEAAYRLVSIPLDLDDRSPGAVFEDDLGTYDPQNWRFYGLRTNQTYAEFPSAGAMAPGRAFWLAVRATGQRFDTGAGATTDAAEAFAIPLNAGWTFVGSPFNFDVTRDFIMLESGGAADIRAYNGAWTVHATGFRPFEGYAVASNATDRLLVYPNFIPPQPAPEAEAAPDARRTAQTTVEDGTSWAIRIEAHAGGARDVDTRAMVAEGAAYAWDRDDRPEPPVIGRYVSVYFPHPEWGTPFAAYSVDARPIPAASEDWTFEVRTNVREAVTLSFEGLGDVPRRYGVWLVDDLLGVIRDLRLENHYVIGGLDPQGVRRLRLVVGEAGAVGDRAVPDGFMLKNYPNPFNPSTTIHYGLPAPQRVTLKIYNLLGEEVATLAQSETRDAGFHAAVWDGRDAAGRPVSSGLYVYRLQGQDFSLSRTMLLVK